MNGDREPRPDPKRGVAYRFRAHRMWASGQVLGQQLVLAQNAAQILAAAWPLFDSMASAGEQQIGRNRIAGTAARMAQDEQIRVWQAGMPGYDRWAMAEQLWEVEEALLASRDQVAVDPAMAWPEDGPRLVLARHLHPGAKNRPGTIAWVDSRSSMTLLNSIRGLGLIEYGRI